MGLASKGTRYHTTRSVGMAVRLEEPADTYRELILHARSLACQDQSKDQGLMQPCWLTLAVHGQGDHFGKYADRQE